MGIVNKKNMKFIKSTIIALVSAAATSSGPHKSVEAWNMGGGPMYLSVPSLKVSSSSSPIDPILERERAIAQRMFNMVDDLQQQQRMVVRRYPSLSSSLPAAHKRYELIDNNEKFELKVDVPGVKEEDLDIKIDDGKIMV